MSLSQNQPPSAPHQGPPGEPLDELVSAHKPQLVALAEAWVQEGRSAAATTVEKGQLRLLLETSKAEPLPVLANLLRYQIGRDKGFYATKRHRREGRDQTVDQRLLDLIERRLPALAAKATECEAHRPLLEQRLATQLLGFIVREYTFQAALRQSRPKDSQAAPTEKRAQRRSATQPERSNPPRRQGSPS